MLGCDIGFIISVRSVRQFEALLDQLHAIVQTLQSSVHPAKAMFDRRQADFQIVNVQRHPIETLIDLV